VKQARPQPGAIQPYYRSEAVVPGDLEFDQAPSALLVGGAGVVIGLLFSDGAPREFTLEAGIHRLSFRAILPGTTATDLVALF